MKRSDLQRMVDGMVAESIRRLLPEIMNEVLLRTIARSGVVQERREPPEPAPPAPTRRRPPPTSLREIMDESAGAEFYSRGEPEPSMPPPLAQRISQLPPELRMLAEDTVRREIEPGEPAIDEDTADALGFDFGKMRAALQIVETKNRPVARDLRMEEARLARERAKLEIPVKTGE